MPVHRPDDALTSVVKALVLYSLAEAQVGHASIIDVQVNGRSFEVGDDGRGHSIDKTIDGTPYLSFIYEQFAFPFDLAAPGSIQLQGIGMSFITSLCSELQVTVRRSGQELSLSFKNGRKISESRMPSTRAGSGNILRGLIHEGATRAQFDRFGLASWLQAAQRAVPGVVIAFNGSRLVDCQEGKE